MTVIHIIYLCLLHPRQTWNFRSLAVSACNSLWHHRLMYAPHRHACMYCMYCSMTSQANACSYCMGSAVLISCQIYLYLQLLCIEASESSSILIFEFTWYTNINHSNMERFQDVQYQVQLLVFVLATYNFNLTQTHIGYQQICFVKTSDTSVRRVVIKFTEH